MDEITTCKKRIRKSNAPLVDPKDPTRLYLDRYFSVVGNTKETRLALLGGEEKPIYPELVVNDQKHVNHSEIIDGLETKVTPFKEYTKEKVLRSCVNCGEDYTIPRGRTEQLCPTCFKKDRGVRRECIDCKKNFMTLSTSKRIRCSKCTRERREEV